MNFRTFATCALIVCTHAIRAQMLAACDSIDPKNEKRENVGHLHVDSSTTTPLFCPKVTVKEWLWGVGRTDLLDTYLSPLTYKGTDLALSYQTERLAHWGHGGVTVKSLYDAHVCYAKSPTDDGKAIDAELTAAGGWRYNWNVSRWRIGLGGLMEASGGFTYNTRNSNNPAQARLGLSLLASAIVAYRFPLFGHEGVVNVEMSGQMAGVQFAPTYGQSYYEIFSLGHTNGVVHFTSPANCPSARLKATVTLPVKNANVSVGYMADVRQSKLGGLKRHAWRNSFMIGYTRYFKRL